MKMFGYIGSGEAVHVFMDGSTKALCNRGPGIDMFEGLAPTWHLCQHCRRVALRKQNIDICPRGKRSWYDG